MKVADSCGCFPTGRHYPGIAHLVRIQAVGIAAELDASADWHELLIAFIDTETTGRDAERDRLVEVGIVFGLRGEITGRKSWLINPGVPIPAEATNVHGIHDEDVAASPSFAAQLPEIVEALRGAVPAAYNAGFDRGFFLAELARAGISVDDPPPALRRDVEWLDPLVFAREIHKDEQSRALGDVTARLGIELERAHRATDDAEAALRVLYAFGKDPRLPKTYGALLQEQRRLARQFDEARRFWRR
jgi:DNA polymerase III subunit epsilon